MTPLMYAVKDNRTSLLDRLIDLGSDVGARNNASITKLVLRIFVMYWMYFALTKVAFLDLFVKSSPKTINKVKLYKNYFFFVF